MKKHFILSSIIVFLITLFASLKNVSAQGYFTCYYDDSIGTCEPGENHCDTDCYPPDGNIQDSCSNYYRLQSQCLAQHYCECPPVPTVEGGGEGSGLDWYRLYHSVQSWGGQIGYLSPSTRLGRIISALTTNLFPIVGLLLLIYLLYGGYNYLLAGGDPKKAQAARSIITTALIGFILIFLAYWLVKIIAMILGLGDITDIF